VPDAAAGVVAEPVAGLGDAVLTIEAEMTGAEALVASEPKVVQIGEQDPETQPELAVEQALTSELSPMVTTVVWPALGETVVTVSEHPPGQLVRVISVVILVVYV